MGEASITELSDEELNPFFWDEPWITYRSEKEIIQVERITNKFENCWSCVNLGEKILNDYIETCTFRKGFTTEFIEVTNRQIRERCLSFVCSVEDTEDISASSVYKMLKTNLDKTAILAYIHSFNLPKWDQQLDFVLGERDKVQWKDRDQRIDGIPLSLMMQFMPLSEEAKLELYTELLEWAMPVFKDRTILSLMILLSIFDLEFDDKIKQMRNYFFSILRCYLESKRNQCADFDMSSIMGCISSLQKIHTIFKTMGSERNKAIQ